MKEAVRWHALIPGPIKEPEEALAFVNGCGFCTWGPVPRLSFPNLAEAMGETATSVLERTWSWKDDLHFAQQLYYGKIIAGQPSFLAPDYLPDFIAALAGRQIQVGRQRLRQELAAVMILHDPPDLHRTHLAGNLRPECEHRRCPRRILHI